MVHSHDNMTPEAWANYPNRVRSTHWWELFPDGDGRRSLTWKGLFTNVTDTVNYYSSEEEVLANGNGTVPNLPRRSHAWSDQELWKGNKPITDVLLFSMGRDEGGWGFNRDHYVYEQPIGPPTPATLRRRNPNETTNLTDSVLRECPFFGHFENRDIYTSTNGVIVSENPAYRAQLLADAIPAESFAVGANSVMAWGTEGEDKNNVDMPRHFKSNMIVSPVQNWIHSFFLKVPYMCTHEFYEDVVSRIPKEAQSE